MKFLCLSFTLLMLLAISGCGGGGDSGSAEPVEALTVSERMDMRYEGSTQPIELTEDNAFAAGLGAYMAIKMIKHAETHTDRVASIYHPDSDDPEDDEFQYTVENLAASELDGYNEGYVVNYNGHQYQGFTYRGEVIYRGTGRWETVAENTESFYTYEKFEMVDLSVTSDSQNYVLNGELVKVDGLSDSLDVSLVVNDNIQNKHFRLLNGRYEIGPDEITGDNVVRVSGEFSDSVNGTVTFSTDSPIVDFRYIRDSDTWTSWGGQLLIQGESENIGLAFLSRAFAAVLMDGDFDGVYEKSLRIHMDALTGGQVGLANNEDVFPVSNPGRELRAWVDIPVTLHGLFSHSNNRYLTLRWEVITMPAGSIVDFDALDITTLNFTPDKVGDYVFKLIVDDGISQSESHVNVRAEPDREFQSIGRPVRTEVGALEIASPIALGQNIEIDGRSAMGWDFERDSWYVNALHDSFDDNAELFETGEQHKRNLIINNPGIYEVVAYERFGSYSTINVPFGTLFYDMKITKGQLIEEHFGSFVVADYDGDGSDDFIVMGHTGTVNSEFHIDIYEVDESANFVLRERTPAVMPNGLSWGVGRLQNIDINADDRLDIVITFSSGVLVFYQEEGGALAPARHFDLSIEGCSASASVYGPIDMNGDGRVDMVVKSYCESGSLVYWPQDERGEYDLNSYVVSNLANGSIQSVELGDINGDEYTDVIFGMLKDNNYSFNIALNLGDNTFETRSSISTESNVAMKSGAIADINNDGINDVVRIDLDRLYIYLQNSDGEFNESERYSYDSPGNEGKVIVKDLNHDGFVDILQGRGELTLATQQPDGSFDVAILAGGSFYDISDLNGDGFDDIVVSSDFYHSLPEYRGFFDIYLSGLKQYSLPVTGVEN